MPPPLVSVILPVRNGGKYLEAAVSSILGQTLDDIELILVDDHSDDGAAAAMAGADRRLRLVSSGGRGVIAAFSTGQAIAGGRYIARMDADDIALPQRLELQVGLMEAQPDVAIAGGCVRFFSTGGVAEGNRRYEAWLNTLRDPGEIRKQLFIESPIPNPTALFRADALRRLGGYRDCGWPEDYDLFLRADAAGMKMAKPDGIVLEWRDHPGRLTRTDALYALDRFQAAKAHFLAGHRLRDQEFLVWGAGPTGRRMHDLLESEGSSAAGFIEVHPRRIGGEKRGKPVYAPEEGVARTDAFVVVAVGARGARAEVRGFMRLHGRREGRDYLFVA